MFLDRFKDLEGAFSASVFSDREQLLEEEEAFRRSCDLLSQTVEQRGVVYVIGNGGSAGIASHFSTDLIKTLKIPSQTLYDSNLMTCLSNDLGYENVFSYPLEKLIKKEDLLVAISSSGKSPNILKAAAVACKQGASLFTLSGFKEDNLLRKLGHLNAWVDRCDYGLVEACHFFLLHAIVDLWNKVPLHASISETK